VNERKVDAVLELQPPSRRKLRLGVIDANDVSSAPSEPRGDIRSATSELDHILARDIRWQNAEIRFRNTQIPHLGVSEAQCASPAAAYSFAQSSHNARLRRTWSGKSTLGTPATFLAAYKAGIGDLETANPPSKDDLTIPATIDAATPSMRNLAPAPSDHGFERKPRNSARTITAFGQG
jgi:hypothetical protein